MNNNKKKIINKIIQEKFTYHKTRKNSRIQELAAENKVIAINNITKTIGNWSFVKLDTWSRILFNYRITIVTIAVRIVHKVLNAPHDK